MTPEFKAKWLEALRSGNYTQGKSALRTKDDKFCCLGVACDLLDPTLWATKSIGSVYSYSCSQNGLPSIADLTIMGLTFERAKILADMNDAGYSFQEISNYIQNTICVAEKEGEKKS